MWMLQNWQYLKITRNLISKRTIFISVFVVALMLLTNTIDAQCAMCKQSAESTLKNDPSSMARSLNSGILYLMAVPYIMLMFIFRKQLVSLFHKLKARFSHQKV